MSALELAEKIIISREGFRNKVYLDSRSIPTAGYGHKILPEDNLKIGDYVTVTEAEGWLQKDLASAYKNAVQQAVELEKTSAEFIACLTSSNYQLGNFEKVFFQTFELLKTGDWQDAITHLQNSEWAKETPVRVTDLVNAIKKVYNLPWWKRIFNV